MIANRSAPPGTIVPWLPYPDVDRAIAWLCGAFGFIERLRTPPAPDGSIHHAQLAAGKGSVVCTSAPEARPGISLFVPVEDVDAHYRHACQYGARILSEPRTCEFGERQYSVEDLAGYRWTFSQSVADVAPREWGAIAAKL
jgi:uncharacterized glyoxalase superfamily protein PhnB